MTGHRVSAVARACFLLLPLSGVTPAADVEPAPPATIRVQRVDPDGVLTFQPSWRAPSAPPWGLALSGGAALGQAHIGVLREMERDGLRPDLITGTSAGSLIGGMYVSGYSPDAIEAIFRRKNWNTVFRETPRTSGLTANLDPLDRALALSEFGRTRDGEPLPWRGLVPDWQIFREFVRYFGRAGALIEGDLDRLPIPFRAVACDLRRKEVYAPRHTQLPTMIRASIGLPIFAPVIINDRILIDGGVLENIPVPTARSIGADVVVAVYFDGSDEFRAKSFLSLLGRAYSVGFGAQRASTLEDADALVRVDTALLSGKDFHGQIDELVAAGEQAWHTDREAVLQALERDDSMVWYEVRVIEAGDHASAEITDSIEGRLALDGSPRRISSLRLELELARLMNTGRYDDAWFRALPDGRFALSVVPAAAIDRLDLDVPEALEPMLGELRSLDVAGLSVNDVLDQVRWALLDALREGYFLAGISSVSQDDNGTLHVRVESGTLSEVDMVTADDRAIPPLRPLRRLQGQPAKLGNIERALAKRKDYESLERPRSTIRRVDDDYVLKMSLNDPPRWRANWTAGLADALGIVVMGRVVLPAAPGTSHWTTELRAGFDKEIFVAGVETRPAWDRAIAPFVRASVARPGLHFFDEEGQSQSWRYFWTGIAGAGFRTAPSAAGRFEFGPKLRWTGGDAFYPETRDSAETDLSFEVRWEGNLQDRSRAPRRGFVWALGGAAPLAGKDRPWVAMADVSITTKLGKRFSLGLLGRITRTGNEESLPTDRWAEAAEAGVWWETPGLDPGRSRAREVERATLVLRRDFGEIFGANLVAGVSVAAWDLSGTRLDPFIEDRGKGASAFIEVSTARVGPVTIGYGRGDAEGESGLENWFILLSPDRIAWPGPIRPRRGAVIW